MNNTRIKKYPHNTNYMVVYIIKVIGSPIMRTFIDYSVRMFVFVLRSFPSKRTYSPTQKRPKKSGTNVRSLNTSLNFVRLFFGSACPRTHVLLNSVSHESNTFTSLNIDITMLLLNHHTQSQHSHMSLLSLNYILFLSCNVCFYIHCLCLLMLIDLVIDLLLLTNSFLTFKYTLQL